MYFFIVFLNLMDFCGVFPKREAQTFVCVFKRYIKKLVLKLVFFCILFFSSA